MEEGEDETNIWDIIPGMSACVYLSTDFVAMVQRWRCFFRFWKRGSMGVSMAFCGNDGWSVSPQFEDLWFLPGCSVYILFVRGGYDGRGFGRGSLYYMPMPMPNLVAR